jgi:hypothetical protein
MEKAKIWMICTLKFLLHILNAIVPVDIGAHGEFHVGLSRCQPDTSNKNVTVDNHVLASNSEPEWPACRSWRKVDAPATKYDRRSHDADRIRRSNLQHEMFPLVRDSLH